VIKHLLPVGFAASAAIGIAMIAGSVHADDSRFAPVYDILVENCGQCHRVGGASSWITDKPAAETNYAACLNLGDERAEHQCTTHGLLTEAPGPEIPAWVRPHQASSSEPYVQACDGDGSFHIGVSLPAKLSDDDCATFLGWIESGAEP
jgi:mono/diheme cytochrome c family protein